VGRRFAGGYALVLAALTAEALRAWVAAAYPVTLVVQLCALLLRMFSPRAAAA